MAQRPGCSECAMNQKLDCTGHRAVEKSIDGAVEVFAGVRPNEIEATEAFLRNLRYYDVTWEIARRAGELQRQWRRKGLTLSLPDVTIAELAIAHRLTLLTDNKKHFPMPELSMQPLP